MGFFDFLLNREKTKFKQTQNTHRNSNELNKDDEENLSKGGSFNNNLKLIEAAKKYTNLKQELLDNGIYIDAETDPYRATIIINDFIHATIEQIPTGNIIPINTSFTKDGVEQILLLGRDIISSSQYVKKTGNKPKHGILRHKFIALMIDKNKAPNIFNPGITNRITIEDEHSMYLINLLTEDFLESQTQTCRLSNIEFNFSNWENSLNQIRNIGQTPYAIEALKQLNTLDIEITNEITNYLNERSKEMEAQLNQVFENNLEDNNN